METFSVQNLFMVARVELDWDDRSPLSRDRRDTMLSTFRGSCMVDELPEFEDLGGRKVDNSMSIPMFAMVAMLDG